VAGATWPGAPDEDNGTATFAASNTDYTVATKTPATAGLYWCQGRVDITPAAGDLGKNFWPWLTDGATSSPLPKVKPKITGQVQSVSVGWLVELDGSTAVTLKVRKDGGSGTTSTAAGSIDLWRFGKL
jgi:Flp pilus assembly protein TadG